MRISLVNAFEFYGFSEKEKLSNIRKGLIDNKSNAKAVLNGYEKIVKIQKEVEDLKKVLEQWDQYE